MAPPPAIHIQRDSIRLSNQVAFSSLEPRTKLVCKCIADHYNDDVGLSWPGIDRIAVYASCAPNTVRAQLTRLQSMGVLELVPTAERPPHLRRIKSRTWRINPAKLPAGQLQLIDLDDGLDDGYTAPNPVQAPAAPAPAPTTDHSNNNSTPFDDLIWPDLYEASAIVYADGYTPPPPAARGAVLAFEGAISGVEPFSLTAPELKNCVTEELTPRAPEAAAPAQATGASPRRASHAATLQDCPVGVETKTWTKWIAIRAKKRRGMPTEHDMAALATEAAHLFGHGPSAVQQALAVCVQRDWATFEAAWVKPGSLTTASGQRADLNDHGRAAQAIAARYGLGGQAADSTTTSPEQVAHHKAKLAELRASIAAGMVGKVHGQSARAARAAMH